MRLFEHIWRLYQCFMVSPLAFFPEQLNVHPFLLTGIFLMAGILGGFVGYVMNNASVKWRGTEFIRSLFFGMVISTAMFVLLVVLYSELFAENTDSLLNFILAGCICFMVSVVSLMFCYRFLMRVTTQKRKRSQPDAGPNP